MFYSLRPHPVSIRWVNPPVDAAGYAHVRHCLVCAAKRQKEGADTTANESENVGEEREKRKEGREGREGKGRAERLVSSSAGLPFVLIEGISPVLHRPPLPFLLLSLFQSFTVMVA